jgi:hypothetical protein
LKNRNCEAELTLIDKLKKENKELKLQISKLERVISRINPEDVRLKNVKELKNKIEQNKSLDNEPTCPKCNNKIFKLKVPYNGGVKEIIRCSNALCKKY